MTRIARLSKEYYVNFDDHCLYSEENKKVAEISKKSLEVLKYFCEYPNCYKQIDDINQYLEEGCLSSEAIRSRIYKLRESHPIIREVLTHNSSGYKYIGRKIESVDDPNLNGQSGIDDDDMAFRTFQTATEQDAMAQCYLGLMYVNGRGIPQNDDKAYEWFRKAAEQGNAVAQCHLALMYENGRGVIRDERKAYEWFRRAAE